MGLAGEVVPGHGVGGVGRWGDAADGREAGGEDAAVEGVLGVGAVGARGAEIVFFVERGAGFARRAEDLVEFREEVGLLVEVEGDVDVRDAGEAWGSAARRHCEAAEFGPLILNRSGDSGE